MVVQYSWNWFYPACHHDCCRRSMWFTCFRVCKLAYHIDSMTETTLLTFFSLLPCWHITALYTEIVRAWEWTFLPPVYFPTLGFLWTWERSNVMNSNSKERKRNSFIYFGLDIFRDLDWSVHEHMQWEGLFGCYMLLSIGLGAFVCGRGKGKAKCLHGFCA